MPAESFWPVLASALAGGLAYAFAKRWLVVAGAACVLIIYAVVTQTPLMRVWLPPVPPASELQPDAVIVLSTGVTDDNFLAESYLPRLLHGLSLAAKFPDATLVTTRIGSPTTSGQEDLARLLSLTNLANERATLGVVLDTEDEARLAAKLSQASGWNRVALVTSPVHMPRALAAFKTAGVPVTPAECPERSYTIREDGGLPALSRPADRLEFFREWIYEVAAWRLYVSRGSIRPTKP